MKHVLKKISAIAMAFTLLGAGTAITKNVAPQSIPTLTANAGNNPNDPWTYNWDYIGTCQRCVVYHWNGSQSTYTYNNLSVYINGDRLRMSTPSVPVPIYVSSVKEAYLIWLE